MSLKKLKQSGGEELRVPLLHILNTSILAYILFILHIKIEQLLSQIMFFWVNGSGAVGVVLCVVGWASGPLASPMLSQ